MPEFNVKVLLTAADMTRGAFASAERGLDGVIARVAAVGALGQTFGAAITGSLGSMVDHSQEYVREITRASAQTAISTQVLYGLRYAAQQTGVEFGTLTQMINRQARSAYQALQGGATGDMQEDLKGVAGAYNTLGVSVVDAGGKLKASDVLFLETAQALSQVENAQLKSALAQAIYGRGAAQMIPLLNRGEKGIAGMMARAQELGLVLTDSATKDFAEYGKAQKALDAANEAISLNMSRALVPAMAKVKGVAADITGSFAGWANDNPKLSGTLIQVYGALGWVADKGGSLLAMLPDLKAGLDIVTGVFWRKAAAATASAGAVNADAAATERDAIASAGMAGKGAAGGFMGKLAAGGAGAVVPAVGVGLVAGAAAAGVTVAGGKALQAIDKKTHGAALAIPTAWASLGYQTIGGGAAKTARGAAAEDIAKHRHEIDLYIHGDPAMMRHLAQDPRARRDMERVMKEYANWQKFGAR